MLAAGTLAVIGLFVIPYKRKQAKDDFRKKIVALRTNLHEALTGAFNNESESAIARLRENVAPYTRYVRAEEERIGKAQSQLDELRHTLSALRARVEATVK